MLATLALALCAFGSGAPAAGAATATMGAVPKAFSTSARVTGDIGDVVEAPAGAAYWRFEVSTNGTDWSNAEVSSANENPVASAQEIKATLINLAPETQYFVRFAVWDALAGEEAISAAPNPSFTTTAPVTPTAPVVLSTDNASEVGFSTAKASGEVERTSSNEDPLFDANCTFEYITDAQFTQNDDSELPPFEGAAQAPCKPNPVSAPGASSVEAVLTGLTAGTTYHLRLRAENSAGSDSKEAASTFTTQDATAPTLATDSAAEVKYTEAEISGTVDPEGGNVNPIGDQPVLIEWTLQYTRADEPTNWQPAQSGMIEGSDAESDDPVDVPPLDPAQLTGLANATEYKFRLVATYAGKEAISDEGSFTTQTVSPPSVTIDPASSITATGAHLEGEVTPGNTDPAFDSTCEFEYITDAAFAPRSERQQLVVKAAGGTFTLSFDGQTTAPIAYNADAATVQSALQALSTVGPGNVAVSGGPGDFVGTNPYEILFGGSLANSNVSELAADGGALAVPPSTQPSATVSTLVSGHAEGFEGAAVVGCAPENPVKGAPPAGTDPVVVSADPTDLEPGTVYHIRLRASNQGGTTTAVAPTFTTEAAAPAISDTFVSAVTTDGATLNAKVNPRGDVTTYRFEYVTLKAFEEGGPGEEFDGAQSTADVPLSGAADNQDHLASAAIAGLVPDTAYRFRVVVSNSQSSDVVGPATGFRTSAVPIGGSDSCPNAAVRAQQGSTYLPECRAYEIVNNPGLDLGDANRVNFISDDGDHALYQSVVPDDDALGGAVASATLASRESGGWKRVSADPYSFGGTGKTGSTLPFTVSSDLSRLLVDTTLPLSAADINDVNTPYLVEVGSGASSMVGFGTGVENVSIGGSRDLSRVAFLHIGSGPGEAPFTGIFLHSPSGNERVSVYPDGTPVPLGDGPGVVGPANKRGPGIDIARGGSPFVERGGSHGVSDDGRRIFFNTEDGGEGGKLYLRDLTVSPAQTYPVTALQRTGDPPGAVGQGRFIAASHDASTAYFISTTQYTDQATLGGGIYRWQLSSGQVEQVTPATGGAPFGISGAIASDDLSHIYFTSTNALAGAAQPGDANAYVWSAAGGVRFIAKVDFPSNPIGTNYERFERVTPNGRYALIQSVASIDGAPNAGHRALYRYDYATDKVDCVSCRPDGSPSAGEAQLDGQSFGFPSGPVTHNRGLTFDGRVVFTSTDRLIAADQTTTTDVYIWNQGTVSLLSSGREANPSYVGEISDDGKNVFVITREPLVGVDRDAAEYDVYDARIGGGFLEPPPPPAPCEGEACLGPDSRPAPPASSATRVFAGPGNPRPCAKGKKRRNGRCVKIRKARKHRGKKHHHKPSTKRDTHIDRGAGR